ncbi:MAG: class I tRNA ligase family protein [Patescibacteria group bacterium]
MKELAKAYDPKQVEGDIYQVWEDSGFFNPDNLPKNHKKPYSIVLPPPNVTGKLHIGHAAGLAIQDILIRYKRKQGYKTLWLPGMDHAAIATQNVVEKNLKKEGKTRHDLGKVKFLGEVEKFVNESKKTITKQFKSMGSSLDWSRESFTLDENISKTVREVFKKMYDDGLIYRGNRVVNWCPRCQSTLADDEVEYKEVKAPFYYFKYGPVIVGTARPETKFADKIIIVHPKDKRYKNIVGKEFEVEWMEGKIKAKVIADRAADMEMGTGAMTITPAHSHLDFELAGKYNLEIEQIIDKDGKFTAAAGSFEGVTASASRDKIVALMKKKGLVDRIDEEYIHNLSVCYRCGTPVEPMLSKQWFVSVGKVAPGMKKSLKDEARDVVKNGEINIIPDRFNKTYFHWMDNLRDWCISRQIWYGHQIPVWYKKLEQPVEITFFAHGTTEDNEKGIASGQSNPSLSELGKKQSVDLGKNLKHKQFDVIITSDLSRAIETAELAFPNAKKVQDKRLRECDYGSLNGKPGKLFKDMNYYIEHQHPGKGESYQDVEQRLKNLLADIAKDYPGKKVAIIAHKFNQLSLEILINGKTWEQAIAEDWRSKNAWKPGWNYQLETTDTYVGVSAPAGKGWQQDPDTLDTWFSSALWTFSTMSEKDQKIFHPTSVMETGYDILFFWVARMIMMTTYIKKEIPFKDVYLHGLIRTKTGEKMSKSKPETTIDPLEVSQKFGTDAVRLSLVIGSTPGNDVRLYEEKIEGYRNFINKIWNISRYILTTIKIEDVQNKKFDYKKCSLSDKWILSRLNRLIQEVTDDLDNYRIGQAGEKVFSFTWGELADWYLEITKVAPSDQTPLVLYACLENILSLAHPYIPFVTEQLWQMMGHKELLIISKWPWVSEENIINEKIEKEFADLQEIIVRLRNFKAEYNVPPVKKIPVFAKNILSDMERGIIEKLARVEFTAEKNEKSSNLTSGKYSFYISNNDLIDVEKEKAKAEKELAEKKKLYQALMSRLENKAFLSNAPEAIVAKEKEKAQQYQEAINKLEKKITNL